MPRPAQLASKVEKSMYDRMAKIAQKQDRTISYVVYQAIQEYLDRNGRKTVKKPKGHV